MTVSVPYNNMSTTPQSQSLLNRCCCCFTLRIGCFLLGYLSLFSNTVHTLLLLILTIFSGIETHGFDHFDSDPQVSEAPDTAAKSQWLHQVGLVFVLVLSANLIWWLINVACLVGLHKKRPGPIRLYVGLATFRLILSLVCFVYQVSTAHSGDQWSSEHRIFTNCIEYGLTAYFILVYYVYAVQLEKEQQEIQKNSQTNEDNASSTKNTFAYPKFDKKNLVA